MQWVPFANQCFNSEILREAIQRSMWKGPSTRCLPNKCRSRLESYSLQKIEDVFCRNTAFWKDNEKIVLNQIGCYVDKCRFVKVMLWMLYNLLIRQVTCV